MRKAALALAVLLALGSAFWITQIVASESGEVVRVRTFDAEVQPHETRLWIVEHDGASWLRAGHEGSVWLARMRTQPEIEIVRGGETLRVRAVPVPEARDAINQRMHEKYGWADAYITFFFARDQKVAVRLDPR